jgi:hypothetical protein
MGIQRSPHFTVTTLSWGWVIRWNEYTLRGYGQFYERPYTRLDK